MLVRSCPFGDMPYLTPLDDSAALIKRARKTIPLVNPSRLRLAREIHGWTQTELSARTDNALTGAAISQLEAGKSRPSARSLAAIASATDYPIEYFVRHRGDVEAVAFFRSLRSAPARERKRALAWAHLLHDFTTVLDDHLQLPSVDVPRLHIEAPDSVDEVEELANAVRSEWDLTDGPIPKRRSRA